jgi:hypothetical protein
VIEDFIIPPPVSDETPSQKTRRAPITHIGRASNSNSSSTTQRKRDIIADDSVILQRGWLSRTYNREGYVFDSVGGEGSFVYMINTGINIYHNVSNFFHFVAFLNNIKIRLKGY